MHAKKSHTLNFKLFPTNWAGDSLAVARVGEEKLAAAFGLGHAALAVARERLELLLKRRRLCHGHHQHGEQR